ncbi:polyketide synthase [Microthyrium microscopicum]|uniref:Polyketide synthase n=1 Tax=Microthyrium microscopicum TaxID=703497 RepID=A0A6A6U8R1_9PEZI|nr:polyketide synthase [Microthyrium microscopicum]
MASRNDIAVIGMSCRFPGEAKSPDEFFEMLLHGRSAWSEIPNDRFDINSYWHPSHDRHGCMVGRGGHFLAEDVGLFDAPFFSFTAAEAQAMDPQHRMLLEVTYESLENAGIPLHTIAGSDMPCFVGGFTKDYEKLSSNDLDDTLLYSVTGNGISMLSNRLSWFYDLRGESVTFDTACSSSLVALHHACASVRASKSGCRQAIVAGSNLMLIPDPMVTMNPLHMLSPDSQCFTFDKRANGFVRGEGFGVLILKHIDDAIRDNDHIHAVIRGTGVNQDGRTPGITLPSADAQARLIQATYEAFNLSTSKTTYFEAHGTGTPAGDAAEIAAIASVFNRSNAENPLFVGSVKPNIGHLEGAAGIASLIKSILAVSKGIIFPSINFEHPNPKLKLSERNLKIATEPTPWPTSGLRRASINSFGYGGTNAHCVIDDAFNYLQERGLSGHTETLLDTPAGSPQHSRGDSGIDMGDGQIIAQISALPKPTLITLSTPDQAALLRLAKSHSEDLKSRILYQSQIPSDYLEDLAFTYNSRRSVMQWRTCTVAYNTADLAENFSSIQAPVRKTASPGLIFCFTGQGAQWYAMGRELMIYDVYRSSVETAASYLSSTLGCSWSVMTELFADEMKSNINMAQYSQPLCTIVQVALVDLLQHWGAAPKIVVGHSSGEIASAYASGAISAEDAWKIGYHRGRLCGMIKELAPELHGSMLAVGLSPQDIEPFISKLNVKESETLTIACYNSPTNITMSGDTHLICQLEIELQHAGVFCRLLRVENAYHSAHIKTISELFRSSIADIKPKAMTAGVVMFSSVTAGRVQGEDLGVEYWIGNTLAPASFTQALEAALLAPKATSRNLNGVPSVNTIIEIGPHSALKGPIREILAKVKKADSISYVTTLIRNKSAADTAVTAIGALWCRGFDVALNRVNSISATPRTRTPIVDLPKYPWNHDHRYWHESTSFQSHRFRAAPRTDLLGRPEQEFDWNYPTWKNFIRISEQPWIRDHQVHGSIIFPAAAMLCAAVEAAKALVDDSNAVRQYEFRNVNIGRALVIPQSDPGIEVWTRLKPLRRISKTDVVHRYQFTFTSLEATSFQDRTYVEHASGTVTITYKENHETDDDEQKRKTSFTHERYLRALESCTKEVTGKEHYSMTQSMGIEYGPAFNGLKSVNSGSGEATFLLEIQDIQSMMPSNFEYPFLLHPTTLDVVLHSSIQAFIAAENRTKDAMVPVGFEKIIISANIPNAIHTKLIGYANAANTGFNQASAHINISTDGWPETLIEVHNMTLKSLGNGSTDNVLAEQTDIPIRVASRQIWKPAIDLVDPSNNDLSRLLCKEFTSTEDLTMCAATGTRVAAIYIKRALRMLPLEIQSKVSESSTKVLAWMTDRYDLALSYKLPNQTESECCWTCMSFEEEQTLIDSFKEMSPTHGEVLERIGTDLIPILTGLVEPYQLLSQNGALLKSYTDDYIRTADLAMLKSWFDLQGHKHPDMKILEIGAGTPSATLQILSTLDKDGGTSVPRFRSFCITDTEDKVLEAAQAVLKDWDEFLEYKALDIKMDPQSQGFLLGSLDVITCGSNLFAVDLDSAFWNCFQLLKPGGKLVVNRPIWTSDHIELISRVVPQLRPSHDDNNLSLDRWAERLRLAGFQVQKPIIAQDTSGNPHTAMLIARKPVRRRVEALKEVTIIKPVRGGDAGDILVNRLVKNYTDYGSVVNVLALEQVSLLTDPLSTREPSLGGVISLVEAFEPVAVRCSQQEFEAIQSIVLASNKLLWVSCRVSEIGIREPDACIVSGILRTARSENVSLRAQELHVKRRVTSQIHEVAAIIRRVAYNTWDNTSEELFENEIVEVDGFLQVPRIVDDVRMNRTLQSLGRVREPELHSLSQIIRPLKLTVGTPGLLETLHFTDDPSFESDLSHDHVEIDVKAIGLDIHDALVATAKVPGFDMGLDAAGIVVKAGSSVSNISVGDRVAFMHPGSLCTKARIDSTLLQKLPNNMSFEEGAAIPATFVAAYHALIETARLSQEDTVLIHATPGGLGQAVIATAQLMGAEIFVTVDSEIHKESIILNFGLAPDHVFVYHSLSFVDGINRLTAGKGADIVLTTLSGEALRATWDCVALFGRVVTIHTGKILESNQSDAVDTRILTSKNITLSSASVVDLLRHAPRRAASTLEAIFSIIRDGRLKPRQPTVTDLTDIGIAIRNVENEASLNKQVLKISEVSEVNAIQPDLHPLKFNPNASYVLAGGLGGVGRGLASYMAQHGAKHIAFLSRSGGSGPEAGRTLEQLKEVGVNAAAYACDIADHSAVAAVLDQVALEMPPIKGLVQAAMVISDGLFETMSFESWKTSTLPKIQGTWNLHELMPNDLDFFILFSSASGILGNRGQSNYAAGNTYQDAVTHYRRSLGLASTTLDFGAIKDIGWLSEHQEQPVLQGAERLTITAEQLFAIFKSAVTGYTDNNTRLPCQLMTGLGTGGLERLTLDEGGTDYYWLSESAKFSYLQMLDSQLVSGGRELNGTRELKDSFSMVTSFTAAIELITKALADKIAKSLLVESSEIDLDAPISFYGIDSLMAAEMRNWCLKELQADIPVFEFLGSVTLVALARQIAESSALVPDHLER